MERKTMNVGRRRDGKKNRMHVHMRREGKKNRMYMFKGNLNADKAKD